jgi:hypothetical protein
MGRSQGRIEHDGAASQIRGSTLRVCIPIRRDVLEYTRALYPHRGTCRCQRQQRPRSGCNRRRRRLVDVKTAWRGPVVGPLPMAGLAAGASHGQQN